MEARRVVNICVSLNMCHLLTMYSMSYKFIYISYLATVLPYLADLDRNIAAFTCCVHCVHVSNRNGQNNRVVTLATFSYRMTRNLDALLNSNFNDK